ncbi:MAG: FAD:protein FMN transferase [Nitrospirae bacterium]|nr:FAD:protein FMN transferase [Nitrospirota bacterium]
MKRKGFYLVSLILIIVLSGCNSNKERMFKKSEILMDTIVSITVVSKSKEKAEAAIDKAFKEIKRLERLLNFYSEESEIAEINKNSGMRPVKVSPETYEVVDISRTISEKTGGAFDITIGPISGLYDFVRKKRPSLQEIHALIPLVGYKKMVLNPEERTVYLQKKGMKIDPGGIAKGYAADRAVEILKKEGIKAALVAIAGDIRCFGTKPDGGDWIVGIQNPRAGKGEDVFATIRLKDMAISTSGDYQRYFIEDGKRYHHILDPATGLPARGLISVSVVGPLATYTDSLATAVFVKGLTEGKRLAERMGYHIVAVDRDGNIHISELIKDKISLIVNRIDVKGK